MQTHSAETVDGYSPSFSPDNYSKNVVLILLARMLERTAFYGFQTAIVFYLVSEPLKWVFKDAFDISSLLTTALIVLYVFGGALGDFVTGHRNSLMLGGILSAIGMLLLCITEQEGIYVACGLIALGVGISTPNLQALFATVLSSRPAKMDAGFTWLMIATNIGSFIGALFIGLLAFDNIILAFCLCAVANIVATLCIYFTAKFPSPKNTTIQQPVSQDIFIYMLLVGLGVLWFFYQHGSYELEMRSIYLGGYMTDSPLIPGRQLAPLTTGVFTLIFSLVFGLIWSVKMYHSVLKLLHGVFLLAAGFLILVIDWGNSDSQVFIFIIIAILLAIGQVHISASSYSLIALYAPKKFISTIYGCTSLINVIVYKILEFLFPTTPRINHLPGDLLLIAIAIILVIGFGMYKLHTHFTKPAA